MDSPYQQSIRTLLSQPVQLPPDPPVKVRILDPFMVSGRRAEVGEIVTLPTSLARGMVAIRRAELVGQ